MLADMSYGKAMCQKLTIKFIKFDSYVRLHKILLTAGASQIEYVSESVIENATTARENRILYNVFLRN